MKNHLHEFKRKKVIVFGVEGKNNKTETIYFYHFKPADDDYILKIVSCGSTDPKNMLNSIKQKRKRFDYNASEDKTFLFFDTDCRDDKLEIINNLKKSLPKDISFIVSSPTFELWFLNHFALTSKSFRSNVELMQELGKYVPDYQKSLDVFKKTIDFIENAISNSTTQIMANNSKCYTDVFKLFDHNILKIR